MAQELTKDQYQSLVAESTKPVVLDFYAAWCGPCKQLGPQFDAVAHELGSTYNFFKVNVDEESELAAQFSVTSIPTLVFIKNGSAVDRAMGYMSADDLKDRIAAAFK